MALIPSRFLVRLSLPCRYLKEIPREEQDRLLDLPETFRLDNFADWDDIKNFADVRLAWNQSGLGFQVRVLGKQQASQGDAARPRVSDGVALWLDTRDARSSHRATRYCHQFHFLPAGDGPHRDQPVVVQSKINRALQDAPTGPVHSIPFRCAAVKGGYLLEAFLPQPVLHGFDPEQNRRLGFFYAVRDSELGEQVMSVDGDFPYWEDPSLWSVLELVGRTK